MSNFTERSLPVARASAKMALMLSYRHAFHAGNHADVLKHATISRIVANLLCKEKPFSYLDTHAGAGIYGLDGEWAQKTNEATAGILALLDRKDIPVILEPYIDLCRAFYRDGHRYPGSPEIVRSLARESDQLTLMELHPTEIENLRSNLSGDPRVHVHHRDGYAGVLALSPPDPRRGFALVDPSFETVDDYTRTAETLIALHRRWPVGILALWYPIVGRRDAELYGLKDRFAVSGIQGILTAELRVKVAGTDSTPTTETGRDETAETTPDGGYGLIGSGMLIVSPPWKLADELAEILPWLAGALGENGNGSYAVEWISPSA